MTRLLYFILGFIIAIILIQTTRTTKCDEIITYPNGGQVCEIFLREDIKLENNITEGDRI